MRYFHELLLLPLLLLLLLLLLLPSNLRYVRSISTRSIILPYHAIVPSVVVFYCLNENE